MGHCDSDSKDAGLLRAPRATGRDGRRPPLCFSMIQRQLSVSGWDFHWLFQTGLEGEKKERKKKIKFQFPSIALGL